MALADYGKSGECEQVLEGFFIFSEKGLEVNRQYQNKRFLNKLIYKYKKENIAFALQKTLEKVVISLIKQYFYKNRQNSRFYPCTFFQSYLKAFLLVLIGTQEFHRQYHRAPYIPKRSN